ncbi:MAG: YMGG-like glycine zipper-containing protein [Acetobacteraceae bacterium]
MSSLKAPASILASLLLLSACAQTPMGPSVAVMPAPGKPFDVFQADQALCKDYAEGQVAGGAERETTRQLGTAALTTVLGAGLGAAIGGGRGAAIGAASGALGGAAIGGYQGSHANMSLQQRYDVAYSQCMYSRGNQVPGFVPQAAAPYPPPGPIYR